MGDFVIVGCGYVGERLARALPGNVTAVTGSAGRAAELGEARIAALACDLDRLPGGASLPVGTLGSVLIYLVPPPGNGPTDRRLRGTLDALTGKPSRFVYMSTTGVYGDAAGATVNEEQRPQPTTDRSHARLDAETAVRAWCEERGTDWVILRVPGIYGPDRLPLERIRRGDPVIVEEESGPGNRIHVDDLVRVCIAAATLPAAANRLYNVGDGNHASSTAYFNLVARLAGLPEPPAVSRREAQSRLSPATWSFLADSRRVDTTRMREELGVEIRYAGLEEGIRASL
ncbi:MAG: NAD-dependent epimerase/dehydratase family protein [Chloroflexi bacterium]|nr:NAD-dependent epimerase/dehydratase family protein [Chloroflexota bacterium]